MRRAQLVLFVKTPRPGRVKTRLGAGIGMVNAAWWYRHNCARVLRALADARWRITLAIAPDADARNDRLWPRGTDRIAQGPGDLGQRMRRALEALPPGPACIIGSDVPGITRAHVARAFDALGRTPAVLGPAEDGGYWLIGFRRTRPLPPRVFEGVRWSGPHALADTIDSLDGLPVGLVDPLADVDEAGDLAAHFPRDAAGAP